MFGVFVVNKLLTRSLPFSHEKFFSLIVTCLSVLIYIQSFVLNAGIDSKAMEFPYSVEQGEAANCCPEVDDKDAETLCPEEAPATAVQSAARRGEQTRQQRAEDAADTVYGTGTNRVVDVQLMVDELDGKDKHDAADEADGDGSNGRDEVATCRDAHQSCQHAVTYH